MYPCPQAVLLHLPILAKAVGSSEALLELLERARTVAPTGPPSPVTPKGDEITWTRGLCLKNVSMSYPGRSEPVLKVMGGIGAWSIVNIGRHGRIGNMGEHGT